MRRAADPEKARQYERKWRAAHPGYAKAWEEKNAVHRAAYFFSRYQKLARIPVFTTIYDC